MSPESYVGNIYESKKYGPLQLISFTGERVSYNGTPIFNARFLISGAEVKVELYDAISGRVRDPRYGLIFGKIYYSDFYGPYVILDTKAGCVGQAPKATTKFLLTNNIYDIRIQDVTDGNCVDKMAPNKVPIDMFLVPPEDRERKYLRYAKNILYNIKKRIFNTKTENYQFYGGQGVTIDERWMDFDTFYQDIKSLFQYDKWLRFPTVYQLDKDYLQQNVPHDKRIYSKDTCVFLHKLDNINLKNIEYRRDHQNELPSKYYGVTPEPAKKRTIYSVHFLVNNVNVYFGSYDDEDFAAGVYNHWYSRYNQYDIIPLFNNVPPIDPKNISKHIINNLQMITLV